jgi:hypothetical protein
MKGIYEGKGLFCCVFLPRALIKGIQNIAFVADLMNRNEHAFYACEISNAT